MGPPPPDPDRPADDPTTRTALPDLGSGRYTVLESIGHGGMGEVYRALDRQLDRTVAIKAIRPDLASKADVVRRLAREARFAASLDHPFVCKVHELIEDEHGEALLVMEYVEGETLKSALRRGPLDLARAVRLAREVAEALGFAHQKGLVHRDLKPSNIMLTPHGHVKVMDFGVAKALDDPEGSTTTTLTAPGSVIGTPVYMSPEQAAGDHVDHRSDIFSFGVVLYESLAGELPFEGTSAASYLRRAAIGAPKPLPKQVPAELREVILKCLEKNPDNRYASFEVLRSQLDTAALSLLSVTSTLTLSQRIRLGPRPWLAAVVLAGLVVAGYFVIEQLRPGDAGAGRVLLQRPVVTWPSVEDGSRVSPDGTAVSFVSNQGGGARLWIRSVAGSEPKPITAAREAIKTSAWSPDGKQIAHLFRSDGRPWLQIVSVWGEPAGPARPLAGAWDDVALVRWIGSRIYFSVSSGSTWSTLWRHDTATGADAQVTHASGKRFTASGHIVDVDVQNDERRIVFAADRPDEGLWTADLDGRNAARLPIDANFLITPRFRGADGRRVVYLGNESGQVDVWEYNLDTRTRAALTTSPLEEDAIDVSASGSVIVADTMEQVSHLWCVDPDSASSATQLTNDSRSDLWPSISPSGRLIFHRRQGSFVVYTPDDTEVVAARWTDRRFVPGEVIGPGAGGGISADGRRVFFLRWTAAAPGTPEFWVKDLDSPAPGRKLWDRFWFTGNHSETWAPLGQTAVWAPRGSDDLFFVRRTPSTDLVYELVRAAVGSDLTATTRVLATSHDEQRFFDLSVSDDSAQLGFVLGNRRPYRGGIVQVLNLSQPDSPPKTVFQSPEGAQLYVRGWTRRGTIVVLKSLRPDRENTTEVWEVSPRGGSQRIAVIHGLLGMTSRLDALHDRLFATSVERGVATVRAVSLSGGGVRTVVGNLLDGVTFGGYGVTSDGWLLYMRKETNNDVWLFDFADRDRGGPSPAGDKK